MRNEKHFLVKEISEKIGSSDYVYFVSFAGLKVKELEDLRGQLAAQSACCHVLKNTLIKKACELLNISGADSIALTEGTAMTASSSCSTSARSRTRRARRSSSTRTAM